MKMNIYNISAGLLSFSIVLYLLEEWKEFIIPLVIAIGLWFFFNAVANRLERIQWKGRTMPLWLRYIITALFIGLLGYFATTLLKSNIVDLQDKLPAYQENFQNMGDKLLNLFGWDAFPVIPEDSFSSINFSAILGGVFDSLSSILGNTFLILIYFIFLLIEQRTFGKKLKLLFDKKYEGTLDKTINRINNSVESYILIKTLVSLLTGLLSFVVLKIVGVDFALFWAFLIFLLNFIPSIGSLIATVFPVVLAVVQFDTLGPAIGVLIGISVIQLLIGNFLEPKLFGKSLKISSLAVLLSLTFWGILWGVTGMFLCVPITVILMIIANSFESTKPVAILLSDDGEF